MPPLIFDLRQKVLASLNMFWTAGEAMAAVAVICGRNNGLTLGPERLGTGHF